MDGEASDARGASSRDQDRPDGPRGSAPAPAPDPQAPVRLIARMVVELTMARAARWHPLTSPDPLADLTVQTVLSAGIAHLPYRTPGPATTWHGFSSVATHGRAVTITAVSRSNGLSYPSVRRRALELIEEGRLVRRGSRLEVPASMLGSPAFAQVVAADAAALAHFVEQLAATGHPLARRLGSAAARLPDDVAARALLAFSLRAVETLTALYGDITIGRLVVATVAANVRHITNDPAAARLYAVEGAPPPDSERRPISLRELSRQAGRPFETVRRRCAELIEQGVMEVRGDGVVVPVRYLMGEAQRANNRRMAQHVDHLLRLLASIAPPY